MSRPIDAALRPWLLACALAVTLPHAPHQPLWLSGLLLALLVWSLVLWRRQGELPGRWSCRLLVVVACVATLAEYRTLLGREAGVALLILFMAMKLLETRRERDVFVLVSLGNFLLLTQYFNDQSLLSAAWLLASLGLLTATLVRAQGRTLPPAGVLREAGRLLVQALPLMLLLFLLFPRVNGPLWGLPSDAHTGRSGLSDEMSPGSISELVQSGEIAFRARFAGAVPARQQLYWRGPVLERFDGRTWRPATRPRPAETIEALGPAVDYELTLEAHQQRWLLALEAPLSGPPEMSLNGTLTALARQPVSQRLRLNLRAVPDYRFNRKEDVAILALNQRLPATGNPRSRALAAAWQRDFETPTAIVDAALRLFASDFSYTLRPPLLGEQAVDQFLFESRRGFCEHFAGAFVFLMRAADIPARVVTGYQGGELNPVDRFLAVRQSDAHAWAEVWLSGRGWVRVDPTAVVAPSRVDTGVGEALGSGEPLPALLQIRTGWLHALRFRWEALNNAWNQYVLGYNQQRQQSFLEALGLAGAHWQTLAMLLAIGAGLILASLTLLTLYRRPAVDPARHLWLRALARLARHRLHCAPAETPRQFLARVCHARPALASAVTDVVAAYEAARYGQSADALDRLRQAVDRLP